jgi:creatinine amidohydrolase
MFAVSCMASRLGLPDTVQLSADESRYGIHGGLVETSLMLHLRPDLVRMENAADFRSAWLAHHHTMSLLTPEGGVGFGWETQDLHPSGALGDAGTATAEMGHRTLEHQAVRLVQLLDEVRRFDLDSWFRDTPQAGA